MDIPRLTGYPVDPTVVERARRERYARRARTQAARRRWLTWLAGGSLGADS